MENQKEGTEGVNLRSLDFVALYARKYQETRHPYYAWCAYNECRTKGLEIPQWVLHYFDLAALNLHELTSRPFSRARVRGGVFMREQRSEVPGKKKITSAIAEAFGFVPGGIDAAYKRRLVSVDTKRKRKSGAFNPLAVLRDELAETELAGLVWSEAPTKKHKLNAAYQIVAAAKNVSISTVQRAWKKYSDDWPRS